jgi:hypothetical protein
MSPKTIICPDCGLDIRVLSDATGSKLVYDINDWQRRCRRPNLGGVALCLVRRKGANVDNGADD